jgi:uroporphyrin-III C-methyltransferase
MPPGDSRHRLARLAATARDARLTLVIYMGVSGAAHIQQELLTGLPPHPGGRDPARQPARPAPRHHHAWASCTPPDRREQLGSPSVIVVGDVVRGVAAAPAPEATRRIA